MKLKMYYFVPLPKKSNLIIAHCSLYIPSLFISHTSISQIYMDLLLCLDNVTLLSHTNGPAIVTAAGATSVIPNRETAQGPAEVPAKDNGSEHK